MISLIIWALAIICNAVMDRVENENFYESIFAKLDVKFWYKRESWKYAKMIGRYRLDAWHIAKSLMIIFTVISCVVYASESHIHYTKIIFLNYTIDAIIRGVIWDSLFDCFYLGIFKSKSNTTNTTTTT